MSTQLLVVGSVALDSVEAPAGKHDDILGGSASYFAAAASYFAHPSLVAVVGEDFPEEHLAFLRGRGVDLGGLERVPGRSFRWAGRYSEDMNHRTTLDTQLNVFVDFQPHLAPAQRDARYLFLANIHPSLQLDVLSQVKQPKFVAMDTMNLWIQTTPAELAKVLARVDLLVINDEEARLLAGPAASRNLVKAARAILAMGPKTIIIKRGDSGALLFHDSGVFAAPALPLDEVVDPTGAGDCFAGGFMGYLARADDLSPRAVRRAMIYGSVMASLSIEAFSLERLRDLQPAEIEARYRAFVHLTHWDEAAVV